MNLKLTSLLLSTTFCIPAFAADLTDLKRPVLVKPDQKELVVRLASNGTTGYLWFLTHYDHDLLTLKSHQYIAPNTKLVGAPGVEEWRFEVNATGFLAPQMSEVGFVHAQPWVLPLPEETKVTWVTM